MEVDSILGESALSTIIASSENGVISTDIPVMSLGGLSLFTSPSNLNGVTSTVLNLPILRDGSNTQGLVLATGTDGTSTFLLDASQLALLTQNSVFENATFQAATSEELSALASSRTQEIEIIENSNILRRPLETRRIPVADEQDVIQPPIGKGPFRCDVCDTEFTKYGQYQRHQKTHIDEKPHKCSKCQASFNVEMNLQLHEATHSKKDPTCPVCGKKFSRVASLKAHIMFHEKEESLICSECGDEFGTQGQLEKHMKRHRDEQLDERIYACRHCPQRFSKAFVLRDHMKIHIRIKASLHHRAYKRNIDRTTFPHKCETCGKLFLKPSQLIRHNRIHTGERPFKCPLCDKAFNQKGALQIHMTKHSGERPHHCDFCPASFSQRGNLRAHIQRVHIFSKEQDKTLFQCGDCNCAFRKLGSLNAHLSRMHSTRESEDEPAVQKEAENIQLEQQTGTPTNKDDNSNTDLLQQALQNSGLTSEEKNLTPAENEKRKITVNDKEPVENDRPVNITMNIAEDATGQMRKHIIRKVGNVRWHQCVYCSKELKKPSDLVRHIRIHTHEKPYKCFQCFRAFAIKSTLTGHLRTHSGIKDFWCNICNKMFATHGSLKVHMRLHTGQKPFSCLECAKQFRTSGHLKNHMLSHSKDHVQRKTRRSKSSIKSDSNLDNIPLQEPILITDAGLVQQVTRTGTGSQSQDENGTLDRPYRCNVCCHAFKKSSHLKQHVRSHTGEKPYKCIQCTRSFVSNGALKAHIKTHSGFKPYSCPVCDGQFTTNGSLKRHMSTHSEIRPYMCPYCQKTFKTSMNCKKHMKTHRMELAEQGGSHVAVTIVPDISMSEDAVETAEETVSNFSEMHMVQHMAENAQDGEVDLQQQSVIQESPSFVSHDTLSHVFGGQQSDLGQATVAFDQSQLLKQLADGRFTLQNDICTLDLGHGITVSGSSNMTSILQPVISKTSVAPPETEGEATLILPEKIVDENTRPVVKRTSRCQYCNKVFKKSSHLKQHIRSHTGEKPFKCVQCSRTFVSMGILRAHIRTHTGARDFKCRVCSAEFTTNGSLRRHMVTHSSNNPFQCSYCSDTFRTKLCYDRHIKVHKENPILGTSGDNNAEESANDKQNKKKTPLIQLTDEQAKELAKQKPDDSISISEMVLIASAAEKNRISELRDKNTDFFDMPKFTNQCDHCPKSFRKPSDLVRHIRTHTGEKPYSCHICLKSFTVKSTLDSHLKTHTGEKNFACHVCNSLFATKGSLKVHMRLHTGAKPFKCPHCQLRFRTSGHRKSHIATHFREGHSRRKKVVENGGSTERDLTPGMSIPLSSEGLDGITGGEMGQTLMQNIEGIQLQLTPGLLGQNIQITNLDPSLLSQTLQIDANLFHQLQQHGNINITIAPNLLAALQGSDANFLQDPPSSMAVNPNIIIHQNLGMHLGENEHLISATDNEEGDSEHISILPTFDITVEQVKEHEEASRRDAMVDGNDESSSEHILGLADGMTIGGELISNMINIVSSESINESEKMFTCSICSKVFKRMKSLKEHLRVHLIKKNQMGDHRCQQCNKTFSKPSLLERHIRIHTGEKPFACTECRMTFNQKNALQIHMNKHTHSRPYKCHICSAAFTQKGNLKVHIRKSHGGEDE